MDALFSDGERSSVGRMAECGSVGRGFDPHRSPKLNYKFKFLILWEQIFISRRFLSC